MAKKKTEEVEGLPPVENLFGDAPALDFGSSENLFGDAPEIDFGAGQEEEAFPDPFDDMEPASSLDEEWAAIMNHLAAKVEEAAAEWASRTLLVAFNTTAEKVSFLDAIGWKYNPWSPSHTHVHGNYVMRQTLAPEFEEGDPLAIGFDFQEEEGAMFDFSDIAFGMGEDAGDIFNFEDESSPIFTPNDEGIFEDLGPEPEGEEEKKKHHRMRYMLNQMKSTYWQDYFDGTFWCGLWFDTEEQRNEVLRLLRNFYSEEFGCFEGAALAEALGVDIKPGSFRDKKPQISKKMAKLAVSR